MKYFVCSDPHSFTSIMIKALTDAGFDKDNPEHKLILCGDAFDRGPEPVEMYRYLKDLGDKFIFIRGNHEDLFFDARREFMECGMVYSYHHGHNGTDKTVYKLNNEFLLDEVADWINAKSIDYFETEHYIFVHGWIPCTEYDKWGGVLGNYYMSNWRESDDKDWNYARWKNGMEMWHKNIKEPMKTIVCGHYHCGWGNYRYHGEIIESSDIDYYDDEYYLSDHPFIDDGIMAIDTCTALTKKVNVVVIDD